MITPKFRCRQDHQHLYVSIDVPHVKVRDIQIVVEGSEFTFFIKPYYLRLTFSHRLVEQEDHHAQYDIAKEVIEVRLQKEAPGDMFEDLDMVTKLLTRKVLIEEMNADGSEPAADCAFQQAPAPEAAGQAYYGFDSQFCNFFTPLQEQGAEVVDVPLPVDASTPDSRRAMRQAQEEEQFDAEHYAADFLDDAEVQRLVEGFTPWYRPLWKAKQRQRQQRGAKGPGVPEPSRPATRGDLRPLGAAVASPVPLQSALAAALQPGARPGASPGGGGGSGPLITVLEERPPPPEPQGVVVEDTTTSPDPPEAAASSADGAAGCDDITEFTDEEHATLRALPRKQYLVQHEHQVLLSLVDLLLAYTYDHLTTEGEPTCESAWTLVKLSPTLCWLEAHRTLHDVAVAFGRRVCIFPLYRH
eukprot:EG_transcript_14546